MGQDHRSAIGASHQVGGFQGVMRAAPVAAAFRKFTLWLWGHSLLLYMIPVKRADYSSVTHERQARFLMFGHEFGQPILSPRIARILAERARKIRVIREIRCKKHLRIPVRT